LRPESLEAIPPNAWHTEDMKAMVAAIAGSALALAAPAVAAAPTPALRLVANQPLTVRGVHFKSHERVRVTQHVDTATRSKLVRATAKGTFKVTFAVPLAMDPCLESIRVTAVGGRGSVAALKLPQRACPPSP
jgi:hypothetical protein